MTLGPTAVALAALSLTALTAPALAERGGSPAVAHTKNPVLAEALVTLARFNATLVSGMHQTVVHEQECSAAAWTLEWMLLPQMCIAAGAATRTTLALLARIERIGSPV